MDFFEERLIEVRSIRDAVFGRGLLDDEDSAFQEGVDSPKKAGRRIWIRFAVDIKGGSLALDEPNRLQEIQGVGCFDSVSREGVVGGWFADSGCRGGFDPGYGFEVLAEVEFLGIGNQGIEGCDLVLVIAEEDDVVFMVNFIDEGRIAFFGVDTVG